MFGSKLVYDKYDLQLMIFEFEEFFEGEVFKLRELFVYGDYGDKVFFKDDWYFGKMFIYVIMLLYD